MLYYYLGAVVGYSRDAELHFRYIEAACEVNQISEVERMTRESPCYDAERTKNYLKEKTLDEGQAGDQFVVNAAIYPLQYDVVKDFEPVTLLMNGPLLIAGRNEL